MNRAKIVRWIPNSLTLLRVAACPAIIYLFLNRRTKLAFFFFLAACFTDFLDGYAAKKLKATSLLGGVLDPVCDKVYAISLFTLLMVEGSCPAWFLGFLITISLLVFSGCWFLKLPKRVSTVSFVPSRLGKLNSGLQLFWIGLQLAVLSTPVSHSSSTVAQFAESLGYLGLLILQGSVFYRYFLKFRPYIIPEYRNLLTFHRV